MTIKRTCLLAHLATDMADTALPIEALHLHVATTEGLGHLAVLLAELLEDEFTLEGVVVLSTSSALATLSYMD